MAGKGTPATAALTRQRVTYELHSYEHNADNGSYGAQAVTELGLDPARVCKTLVADVDGSLVVAVVPMTGQLDLKALAATAGGKKAKLATASVTQRTTGYVLGGVSPIGQRSTLPTFIDSSVTAHATVYCSAGRRGLEVELSPADLVWLTAATSAAITRT